ncbi:MAG: hypothetical protein ACFE9L_10460 [Candidatus Hodarchaeota archaeon]
MPAKLMLKINRLRRRGGFPKRMSHDKLGRALGFTFKGIYGLSACCFRGTRREWIRDAK